MNKLKQVQFEGFVMAAMTGLIRGATKPEDIDPKVIAEKAVTYAAALMEELEKRHNTKA